MSRGHPDSRRSSLHYTSVPIHTTARSVRLLDIAFVSVQTDYQCQIREAMSVSTALQCVLAVATAKPSRGTICVQICIASKLSAISCKPETNCKKAATSHSEW